MPKSGRIFCMWPDIIKEISVLYFFWLVCFLFQRINACKKLQFSWWHCLIVRSKRRLSSLKRDVNNSVQGSTPKSANGTVVQMRWRTPLADDEREHQFEFNNPLSLVFVVFLFHLLFFIKEDRNTVSLPPLQAVLIEVAYVNYYYLLLFITTVVNIDAILK